MNPTRGSLLGLLMQIAVVGCASTPGARPEEHSVAGHEALAGQQEAEASATLESCKRGSAPPGAVCWTSLTSPSPDIIKRAEMHRKMAADHRLASQALREAEQRACTGIPERDRDESPFAHREDIEGVDPLYSGPLSSKNPMQRLVGAAVRIRAVPGMTAEWLQRVMDCHLARNASMGYAMPEMSYCPLMLKDLSVTVTSTGRGFSVAIRSGDTDTVHEIERRAEALVPAR